MTIGERLQAWRFARGLSQKAAAELAHVSQAAWCDYEKDKKLPRVQHAVRLAAVTEGDEHSITVDMVAAAERVRAEVRDADRARRLAATKRRVKRSRAAAASNHDS